MTRKWTRNTCEERMGGRVTGTGSWTACGERRLNRWRGSGAGRERRANEVYVANRAAYVD